MSDYDERGRLIDDDLAAESRGARIKARSYCSECRRGGGNHAAGCPEEPSPPEWDDMTDDQKRDALAELDHDELIDRAMQFADDSELWQRKYNRIRKDAERWQEVSRHGPAPMQIVHPALGVMTRDGIDADRHVDAAIEERKQRARALAVMA